MHGIKLSVYPVKEIEQAKTLYTKLLGTEPYVAAPYYVGFRIGDLEIGLDPNAHAQGITAPINYWQVDDIHATLQGYLDAGAQVQQAVKSVGGGRLIAQVKDMDSNVIGLIQM